MLTVKGNEHITIKEHAISSFLQLHLAVSGTVELFMSDEERVEIETDENLQNRISILNSGKTLFITAEPGFKRASFSRLVTRVYIREMHKLHIYCDDADVRCGNTIAQLAPLETHIAGECNVTLDIDIPAFKLLTQTEGDVTLTGHCGKATIKTQSEGNLFAKDLIAADLTLKNMSEGNVEVFASETISISHYGEGYVHYYGNARLNNINQKGEGLIRHMK